MQRCKIRIQLIKYPFFRGPRRSTLREEHQSSCKDNSEVLPPTAAILTDSVRSTEKRSRYSGPPALGPVPERPSPPKGCTPAGAPGAARGAGRGPARARGGRER